MHHNKPRLDTVGNRQKKEQSLGLWVFIKKKGVNPTGNNTQRQENGVLHCQKERICVGFPCVWVFEKWVCVWGIG